MSFITRKSLLSRLFVLAFLIATALIISAIFIWSGVYNVGADNTHTRPVRQILQTLRERSIETRASKLEVPTDLMDLAHIVQGAGNYDAMCVACHLSPGVAQTELSQGLYPAPPDLTANRVDAASAFWVIKHGIKASGMPAWGLSMGDVYIWNMAAFLQKLPELDAAEYQALVASSDGHSHGGGETLGHGSSGDASGDHATHDHAPAADAASDHHDMADHHHDTTQPAHTDTSTLDHSKEPDRAHRDVSATTPATPTPVQDTVSKPAAPATSDDHASHDHQH